MNGLPPTELASLYNIHKLCLHFIEFKEEPTFINTEKCVPKTLKCKSEDTKGKKYDLKLEDSKEE